MEEQMYYMDFIPKISTLQYMLDFKEFFTLCILTEIFISDKQTNCYKYTKKAITC